MEEIKKALLNIKELIKKNQDFLNENPEILEGIYDRLSKAVDDDAEKWLRENDPNFKDDEYIDPEEADALYDGYREEDGYGGAGDELFDNPNEPEHEYDDYADEDVAYADDTPVEYQDINEDTPVQAQEEKPVPEEVQPEPKKDPETKSRVSSSGYQDWQPRTDYEPHHESAIKEFMDQGYSHREAERLANAHRGPETFEQALTHRVRPSDMSPKMMQDLKALTGPWLSNARRVSYTRAEAEKNPVKYAKGKTLEAHEQAMGNYSKALKEFQNSDEVKNMAPRERYQAVRDWKKQYHAENPEHKRNIAASASSSAAHTEAASSRKRHLDERLQDIFMAGKSGGESTMSAQEAAQHVGGVKTDAGYSAQTIKDPAASFAEANPDYINSLRDKLSQHLPEDAQARLKNVDSAAKHQNIIRKPKIKAGGNDGSK